MSASPQARRVAVVHDWLTGMRGGEMVLEEILRVVPQAEVFTLFHFPGTVSPAIESRPIHTSYLRNAPALRRHYRWYLPFFPRAIESLEEDLDEPPPRVRSEPRLQSSERHRAKLR